MGPLKDLLSRSNSDDFDDYDVSRPPMSPLLYALSVLLFTGSCLALLLFYIRRKRLSQRQTLLPHHRRSSHQPIMSMGDLPQQANGKSIFVYDEKMNLLATSSNPPPTTIPEIHITFPDEEDTAGQKRRGRVVVVQITDAGNVGMAPLGNEHLPPYQSSDSDRFQSLDLDSIGGLKEEGRHLQR